MFKKFSAMMLALVLLLSFSVSAHAEGKPVSIWLDGQQIEFGQEAPYIEQGTTLVPVQPMFEKLGYEVSWDEERTTVTGTKEDLSVSFHTDSAAAVVNGQEIGLLVPPALKGDTLYVPVRFISELAHYKVTWDHENYAVQLVLKEGSKGFLWKTESKGNTVYLLGSIHIANIDMYPLDKKITDAFKASDYLTVEVDLSDENLAFEEMLEEIGTFQDGTTLKDHVSADTYEQLGDILEGLGLERTTYDAYKPWVVASTLESVTLLIEGYDAQIGIDMYFMSHAKQMGLPIISLETADFQLELLDSLYEKEQEQMLVQSMDSFMGGAGEEFEKLIEMWITGDDAALTSFIEESAVDEAGYKAMLVDRNIGMADKIAEYLNGEQGETYFVVVGAAHMLGDDGIVPLLEKKGFTVERQ